MSSSLICTGGILYADCCFSVLTTKGSLKLARHRRDAYDTLDSASFVPQEGISV